MNGMNVEAEKLRPDLHRRIDSMDLKQLELLRRILLKLELSEVVDRLHDAFDTTRTSGTFNRVDEIIREVRTENPYARRSALTQTRSFNFSVNRPGIPPSLKPYLRVN
jgi:hypothetical protein